MQLQLGEKIRELRQRDGRRQEDLAIALGVTPQAISRWESGGGYPDMEMIPSIANYFHVTIDWLFGYNDAREIKINEILRRTNDELASGGDLTACVEFLRSAVHEFPSESALWLNLGLALSAESLRRIPVKSKRQDKDGFLSYDTAHNAQNPMAHEAIEVLERALTMAQSPDDRKKAVLSLTIHYATMGMYDRARELAAKQSPIDASREFILTYATAGEERALHNGNLLLILLRLLKLSLVWGLSTDTDTRTSEYGVQTLDQLIALYHQIVPDGKFGVAHGDLSDLHVFAAITAARLEDRSRTEHHLDMAIAHRTAYDEARTSNCITYTAPLLRSIMLDGRILPPHTLHPFAAMCKNIPKPMQEELKKLEKYRPLFAD
ncbi:MAG: helix-turn-helix transcriptional regulator [Clostridia bacterium]|nr:helix-turn-helix transcriptional regulator [Clostridia bacterium]